MTGQDHTRHCGNCGETVAAADITCPQCDALLAAYEAPAGATSGDPTSATTPIPMEPTTIAEPEPAPPPSIPATPPVEPPSGPYESITGRDLSSLEDDRPDPDDPSGLAPRHDSPIAESLRETREAADLDDDDAPPPPSEQPVDLDEVREVLGLTPEPDPEPDEPEPEQVTIRPAPRTRPDRLQPSERGTRHIYEHTVTPEPVERRHPDRPTPEQERRAGSPGGFSIQSVIGICVFFIIISRIIGSNGGGSFIAVPLIIFGLFWLMGAAARNSNRDRR